MRASCHPGELASRVSSLASHSHCVYAGTRRLLSQLGVPAIRPRSFAYDYTDVPVSGFINDPRDDDDRLRQNAVEAEEGAAEDWDRHMELHPALDKGRELGTVEDPYLFEEEINDPWDKHDASALVFYTDDVRWAEERGEFDEQTTDALDVDAAARDEDVPEQRERGLALASRLMHAMGWRAGTGIGKRGQGPVEPLAPEGNLDRNGLGFPARRRRRTQADAPDTTTLKAQAHLLASERGFDWGKPPPSDKNEHLSDRRPPSPVLKTVFDKPGAAATARDDGRSQADRAMGSFALPAD
jgi:hypothetical protein